VIAPLGVYVAVVDDRDVHAEWSDDRPERERGVRQRRARRRRLVVALLGSHEASRAGFWQSSVAQVLSSSPVSVPADETSKPATCGSPTLGRFDSYAAPSSATRYR